MRGVNLSRRPFVNRRPVTRVMMVLWVLAGLLVLANLRLFTGYLAESHDIRGKIAEADQALRDELEGLARLDGQIARVSLGEQNRQSLYLNSLISYRTFPWSALFDDLEAVLPPGVRLLSVRPVVRLASEEALSQAEEEVRQEARQRSRRRRARTSTAAERNVLPGESTPGESTPEEVEPPALDEVRLELNCVALDEDSLITFLETLYDNVQFRRPLLRGEDYSGQQVSFSLVVLYRTGKRFDLSPGANADDGGEAGTAEDGEPGESPAPQLAAAEEGEGDGAKGSGPVAQTRASTPPAQPAAPPATPPNRATDERRARQIDEEVEAARRAARERANAEEQQQNETESDRATAIDQRRLRLEELRRRARERRESQGSQNGGVVMTPGSRPTPPPPRGGSATRPPRPTGTGGARQPPPPRNPALEDDPPPPASPETPASGSPRIGGMASLRDLSPMSPESEVRA